MISNTSGSIQIVNIYMDLVFHYISGMIEANNVNIYFRQNDFLLLLEAFCGQNDFELNRK